MEKYIFEVEDIGDISDGSHSFKELYKHRCILFAVICNQNKDNTTEQTQISCLWLLERQRRMESKTASGICNEI